MFLYQVAKDSNALAERDAKSAREQQSAEAKAKEDADEMNDEEKEAAERTAKLKDAVRLLMTDFSRVGEFIEKSGIRAMARLGWRTGSKLE